MTTGQKCELIQIHLNGEKRQIPFGRTVLELLEEMKIKAQTVVVELNRSLLEKSRYSETHIQEGDTVEIVHFVGGGSQ